MILAGLFGTWLRFVKILAFMIRARKRILVKSLNPKKLLDVLINCTKDGYVVKYAGAIYIQKYI